MFTKTKSQVFSFLLRLFSLHPSPVPQDSLGGNSRTLMLACVSPADVNFEETLKPYIKAKALVVHPGNEVIKVKRMFVGTAASNTAGVRCLWFDTTKLDFFNEEFLMGEDEDIQPTNTG